MITAEQIRCAVDAYLYRHPGDADRIAALTGTLAGSDDLASRTTFHCARSLRRPESRSARWCSTTQRR